MVHSKFKVVHIVILIFCDCRGGNNYPRATNDLIAWKRVNDHSLLNQSVEKFPAWCQRTIFLICNIPHSQRLTGAMKNRTRCHRSQKVALHTAKQMSLGYPIFRMPTMRAMKPVRPQQLVQIFPTRFLRTEAIVEFKQRFGYSSSIAIYYILWLRESTGYPS